MWSTCSSAPNTHSAVAEVGVCTRPLNSFLKGCCGVRVQLTFPNCNSFVHVSLHLLLCPLHPMCCGMCVLYRSWMLVPVLGVVFTSEIVTSEWCCAGVACGVLVPVHGCMCVHWWEWLRAALWVECREVIIACVIYECRVSSYARFAYMHPNYFCFCCKENKCLYA